MQNVAEVSDVSARFIEVVDVQCTLCISDTAVSERNMSAVIMTPLRSCSPANDTVLPVIGSPRTSSYNVSRKNVHIFASEVMISPVYVLFVCLITGLLCGKVAYGPTKKRLDFGDNSTDLDSGSRIF